MFHSHKRFYVTQWSATRFYGSVSAYNPPPPLPSDQIAPRQPLKSRFGDSYLYSNLQASKTSLF